MFEINWKKRCWRLAAPIKLVGAAVLFCLPWTEIQCHYAFETGQRGGNPIVTQSGLQAACGTWTPKVQNPFRPNDKLEGSDSIPRASLLILYGGLVVVGIVAGLLLRVGRFRRIVVGVAAAAAVAVLLLQAHFGFSVAGFIAKENIELARQFADQDHPITRGPPVLVMNYTPWFYGAFALPLAAVAVVVLEALCYRDFRASLLLIGVVAAVGVMGVRLRPGKGPPAEKGVIPGIAANRGANPNPGKPIERETSLGSILIYCPPGSFTMGSPATEKNRAANENQVAVTISKGFYLGKCSVTQREFKAVMQIHPWQNWQGKDDDDSPATFVDWRDAAEFCRKLTLSESRAGRLPEGYIYALPTEAQREYACRAGTTTAYSFGDDPLDLEEYAWWRGSPPEENGTNHAWRVGQKKPNPWGFHDLHGNVLEWCLDAFADQLPGGTDPFLEKGSLRAVRGGSWDDGARYCRSASRRSWFAGTRNVGAGFRVALVPASQSVPAGEKTAESRAALDIPVERQWKTSLGSILIECPSGSFTMGRPVGSPGEWDGYGDANVTISRRFFLGRNSVTQAEFKAVMGTSPWTGKDFVKEGDDYPATYVDWNDAAEFCRKLTARESKAGNLLKGYAYALPTEAQWEYACRAGTTTAYSFGKDAHNLADYAWYCGTISVVNARPEFYAQRVGQKKPNPWGFCDMHGNVWDFCRDGYEDKIPGGTDPFVQTGQYRAARGGSWFGSDWSCRTTDRHATVPSFRSSEQGFRLALVPLGK